VAGVDDIGARDRRLPVLNQSLAGGAVARLSIRQGSDSELKRE
jgi:hypothetical protein